MNDLSPEVQAAISRITAAKQCGRGGGEFDWYPYDSFGNLQFFYHLLAESLGSQHVRFANVLDVGCGDGDLAFLFEQLGCQVVVVDWPETNFNRMKGVYELKKSLNSTVSVMEANLEEGLGCLGGKRFDLVLFSGVLYHLQNPFRALSDARSRGRYCFLTTRILGGEFYGAQDWSCEPVAYLADEDEFGGDSTNYWLFSPRAVERLCRRCGWRTMASTTAGTDDKRLYSFLERRDILTNGVVHDGLYEPEEWNEWRWARRKFRIDFRNAGNIDGEIRLKVSYLVEFWNEWGAIDVDLQVNDAQLPKRRLVEPGVHELQWQVEDTAPLLRSQFSVSRATSPGRQDQRELSLVVLSVRYSPSISR